MELPMFYNEADEWNRALLLYDAALKEVNTKIEILNSEFKLAHQYNPIEHITSRIKSPQSIAKKMRHNQRELTVENIIRYINDVAGIRIICSFTSDIYRIANLISKQSDVKVLKVKDYIKTPKENGYTSYHMIVSVPIFLSDEVIPTKVEIQIRTIAMDFWASLEHKMYYKFEGNAPAHIRRELKECADIVSFLDQKMLALNEEIKGYNYDPMNTYKELMADMFQEKVKEAYGTVMDDDDDEDAIEAVGIENKKEEDVVIALEHAKGDDMLSALQKKIIEEADAKESQSAKRGQEKTEEKSDKIPFPTNLFVREKKKKKEMKA
ncbi:MAG: GTP pyrophosphokinase family protein [Lachnospiraceae bacterium]|nr:GTP pyrophosphokinase family protein [Lachnospiraceae bacterium]